MTKDHQSESSKALIGDVTLADAISRLEGDETLTRTRTRDMISAVRRIAELIGRDPSLLPAHLSTLKPGLERVHPSQAGITRKTLQNLRSDLTAALRHLGISERPPSRRIKLSPVWQRLKDLLPRDSTFGHLSMFLLFCSEDGIDPNDVGDETVDRFVLTLTECTFKTEEQVRDLHRRSTRLWNDAAERLAEWPNIELKIPDYRKPMQGFPLKAFPDSFQSDVEAHIAWLAGDDLFGDNPPPRVLKPRTRRLRREHIRLAASALVQRGVSLDDIETLADLVVPAHVKEVMRHYVEKNDGAVTPFMRDLCKALRLISKHYVQADPPDLEELKVVQKRLGSTRSGLTQKNRQLLRSLDDPGNRARFYALPEKLVKEARKSDTGGRHWAVRVQVALAILLLQYIPIRQQNLVALEIGKHLVRPGVTKGLWRLILIEDETKNGDPIDFEIPVRVGAMLELYLEQFRPRLSGKENPYLFPGIKQPIKNQNTLSGQIKTTIKKHTGLDVTGHQFRHIAAKMLLDAAPGNYQGTASLLSHKSTKTTVAYYSGLRTPEAGRYFGELIEKERSKPSPIRQKKRSCR